MIGAVNDELEAVLPLTVLGKDDAQAAIEAVIDTGFNGFLTLPPELIEDLQLPWLYRQQGELADGSFHIFDVHEATILWANEQRAIEIEAANTDPLLGMALLEKHDLRIAVIRAGQVVINKLDG